MEKEEIKNHDINNKALKEATIEVVAFFDMFDCPLTDMEIWEYINFQCDYVDLRSLLLCGEFSDIIESENGFYFLKGRSDIFVTRMKRYNYAGRKFKRALLIAKIFKIVPWIKLICVGNIMGANNLKDESDIDLFIITENKRVWLTRLFCVAITMILGLRPSDKNNRDKICLSFFVSEEGMGLEQMMLDFAETHPAPPQRGTPLIRGDLYFIYWLAGLVPIYDINDTYKKLIEKNKWIYDILPNWFMNEPSYNRRAGKPWPKFYHDLIVMLMGWMESPLMKWQIKKLPEKLKEMMNKDTRVVISDKVIKMHGNDRRGEYLEKLKIRLSKLMSF